MAKKLAQVWKVADNPQGLIDSAIESLPYRTEGAQHILGPFGQDSNLRRRGLKLAERGGKRVERNER